MYKLIKSDWFVLAEDSPGIWVQIAFPSIVNNFSNISVDEDFKYLQCHAIIFMETETLILIIVNC